MMLVTSDPRLMGARTVRGPLLVAGWAVTTTVTILSFFYLIQQITGGGS
jgi:Mn2+/Fe2+ NRAMP family transporter